MRATGWRGSLPPVDQGERIPELLKAQVVGRVACHQFQAVLQGKGSNHRIDVIFPVLHGTLGEDGAMQGLLEVAGIPYVGAGVLASSVGMDKDVQKRLFRDARIPVVDYLSISRVEWQHEIVGTQYRKVAGTKEDNWVWSPQGLIDMHQPEKWGYVQFSTAKPGTATFRPDPEGPARRVLHRIYHAQRAYRKQHEHWAKSLADLRLTLPRASDVLGPPVLQTTDDLFQATVRLKGSDGTVRRLSIRQDSRVWRD